MGSQMDVYIMKDKGLDRGLVQQFETSARMGKGHFYGFRKMFWDYLNKLNVPFFDSCCPDASKATLPVYATNADAVAGGLTVGRLYRTSTGTVRVVI